MRLLDNISLFDFELTDDDMAGIRGCDRDQRVGTHPLEGNWD